MGSDLTRGDALNNRNCLELFPQTASNGQKTRDTQ
jgi:hypothetical protein